MSIDKIDRVEVYCDTQELCKTKFKVPILPSTRFDKIDIKYIPRYKKMQVFVFDSDTIDAALTLKNKGYNPLLLNMADYTTPGGCVTSGSAAQEENLFRRTNYFQHLTNDFYPMVSGSPAVYSPKVLVIKENEEKLYKIMNQPQYLDMIACPAIRFPDISSTDPTRYKNPKEVEIMMDKIRMMLKVGYIYGHDVIVLSAAGCGAWGSPPEHTAEMFKEVLQEFPGAFKYVIFAILKQHNNKNYYVFEEMLNKMTLTPTFLSL
jgi:uncharacterized protein (TIGR02452 family)